MSFYQLFTNKPIIGMIHLQPLPGSPLYSGDYQAIVQAALQDLKALEEGGADAFIVENFGDTPYAGTVDPITFAAMVQITNTIAAQTHLPFGVNVQFNCTAEEWATAYVTGAQFIRVEAFVENRVGIHGLSQAAAPALARQKAAYPANTMIFADINTKHTFATVDQPLDFSIHEAVESGADALIATGLLTGQSPTVKDVAYFKELAGKTPVILGSGVNAKNIRDFFEIADGAIIGSSIKKDGNVKAPVDTERLKQLVFALRG